MTFAECLRHWIMNRPHERMGQAFINDFISKFTWPELFYCEDEYKARFTIEKYLNDLQYWPNVPERRKEN